MNSETIRHNLFKLYGIKKTPSDTWFRQRLDEVEPSQIRQAFKAIFAEVQRGKELEAFKFIHLYRGL